MINSELKSNGLGKTVSGMTTYHKQPPVTIKKIALRDVQNNNWSLIHDHSEISPLLEGRPIADATKVSRTKRHIPEDSLNNPFLPSLRNIGASEHLVGAHRKFESGVGKGRIQDMPDTNIDFVSSRSMYFCPRQHEMPPQQQSELTKRNMHCFPGPPRYMSSTTTFSYDGPSLSISHGKLDNGLPLPAGTESKYRKPSQVLHSFDSKAADDLQRKEIFLHLQRFLKHCDESYQKDYIRSKSLKSVRLHIPTSELSRHAVELEKRAMQLTIEEGKEIRRMKALNILGKYGRVNNLLHVTQQHRSEK